MITLRFTDKTSCRLPMGWDEISPDNAQVFIRLCSCFELFETGTMDFQSFQIGISSALLGINVSKCDTFTEAMGENLYRLNGYLTFPYRIRENEDGSRTASINILLKQNLLKKVKGRTPYRFSVTDDGYVECSVKAEQYVELLELMELYGSSRSDTVLNTLFDTLYPGVSKVSRAMKVAVYYNLRGILDWIKKIPDFRLIFTPSSRPAAGASSPLGLSSSMFSLSKSGYGTLQEIKELDLFTYLAALVQLNIDGILSLRSAGLGAGEIAEKMNLPVECIIPYITTEIPE